MKKWIVKWDLGYGENAEVVEAENFDEAQKLAWELWREDAEAHADYSAEEYTKEEAVNLGLEGEDE